VALGVRLRGLLIIPKVILSFFYRRLVIVFFSVYISTNFGR